MKKSSIFKKTFILTAAALLVLAAVSYLSVYLLLPGFYKSHEQRIYESLIDSAVAEISTAESENQRAEFLSGFAALHGTDIILYDENGNILFDYYRGYSITSDVTAEEGGAADFSVNMGDVAEEDSTISVRRTFISAGEKITLELIVPLERLTEAKAVILEIFPIAFLLCIVLALLLSFFISRRISGPIKALNSSVKDMAEMLPDAHAGTAAHDEIGELSRNVDALYGRLNKTIESLGQEIKKNQDEENRRIDFLRMVSHELKNPLAAAQALVEGMAEGIQPYDADHKKYLSQCRGFLEKASALAKESLKFSKLSYNEPKAYVPLRALADSVAAEYMVFIDAKRIEYTREIPEDASVYTNAEMFSKALSNILSNAVNYTPSGGKVAVRLGKREIDGKEQAFLVIFNSCEPVPEDVLKQLFKKPYALSEDNPESTGLGLYIAGQLFSMLRMRYRFIKAETDDGMVFEIELD